MLIKLALFLSPAILFAQPKCKIKELAESLDRHGVSREWIKVAVVESGWQLNSGLAQRNNFFGLRLAKGRPTTALRVKFLGHATYKSMDDCVKDLSLRLSQSPRKNKESLSSYLTRTNWNPNPAYALFVEQRISESKINKIIECCQ